MKGVLRLPYVTKKTYLTYADVKENNNGKFEVLTNRRKILPSIVNTLTKNLVNDVHFDTPFTVNLRNGTYRLLDGNHRWEACKRFLIATQTAKVQITLHIYEDLTDEQERQVYTKWSKGRKQSTNDVVKQYENEVPILAKLKQKFPCKVSIYGGANAISFYKLVQSYFSSRMDKYQGDGFGTAFDFVAKAQGLGTGDLQLMTAFMTDFLAAFGPIKNNRFLRTTPFSAIMRIWMDNRKNIPYTTMQLMFKRKLLNDKRADDLGSLSGRSSSVYVRDQYILLLNQGRNNNLFERGAKE